MDHFANFDEAFEYLKSMQAAREEVVETSLIHNTTVMSEREARTDGGAALKGKARDRKEEWTISVPGNTRGLPLGRRKLG
ncbi:hypothetical protein [Paenibacillus puerhi]|uniref:hypothetical protein n=1 Tax=Paenibacillus puerhi TaxID=2692622 RepID=UPI00135CBE3C|nr:hypothetical protein [Paenibacillus puerhi]